MARKESAVEARWAVLREESTDAAVGHVLLTISVAKEEEHFIGECPELSVASFGPTIDAALDAVMDATIVHLNTLEELGERERVFSENQVTLTKGAPLLDEGKPMYAKSGEVVTPLSVGLVESAVGV